MKNNESTSNEDNDQSDQQQNAFLSVVIQCIDQIFDYLALNELAALNLTCKQLQLLTADYFQRKYPMKYIKVGQLFDIKEIRYRCHDQLMQQFTRDVRSLVVLPTKECLAFLKAQHNKNLVSISFYDGEISDASTDAIAELVKNVEIVEFQYGLFHGEFYDDALKFCSCIKQLIIKYGFSECEETGIENQWLLKKYPTLEHFHWSAGPLPEHLDTFFKLNPQIHSFNGSIYTVLTTVQFLIQTNISIDELHLELIMGLYGEENEGIAALRSHLNTLYERKQIKSLMLQFTSCSHLLESKWRQLLYLHGAYVDFPHQPGATKALAVLVHLKLLVLGINTVLSRAKANILAKSLVNLEEVYIQIGSIHAITPFLRYVTKINKIYIYRAVLSDGPCGKIKWNHFDHLNSDRMKLRGACKTTVYLPDQIYVEIKWKSQRFNWNLIEVKRSESHILKHPFVVTMLRRDFCELLEKF